MMTDALKPCPFCGGKNWFQDATSETLTFVTCVDCGSGANLAIWNTRSDLSADLVRAGYLAGLEAAADACDFVEADGTLMLPKSTYIRAVAADPEAVAAIVASVTEGK